jgi:hypothetical protein
VIRRNTASSRIPGRFVDGSRLLQFCHSWLSKTSSAPGARPADAQPVDRWNCWRKASVSARSIVIGIGTVISFVLWVLFQGPRLLGVFFSLHPFANVASAILKGHAVSLATHEKPYALPIDEPLLWIMRENTSAVLSAGDRPQRAGRCG